MEKPNGILVANRPRLMRETTLSTFADQPNIEIVGEVEQESEIFESVRQTMPNFVVIALDTPANARLSVTLCFASIRKCA